LVYDADGKNRKKFTEVLGVGEKAIASVVNN
jgi:hypothetical protein